MKSATSRYISNGTRKKITLLSAAAHWRTYSSLCRFPKLRVELVQPFEKTASGALASKSRFFGTSEKSHETEPRKRNTSLPRMAQQVAGEDSEGIMGEEHIETKRDSSSNEERSTIQDPEESTSSSQPQDGDHQASSSMTSSIPQDMHDVSSSHESVPSRTSQDEPRSRSFSIRDEDSERMFRVVSSQSR